MLCKCVHTGPTPPTRSSQQTTQPATCTQVRPTFGIADPSSHTVRPPLQLPGLENLLLCCWPHTLGRLAHTTPAHDCNGNFATGDLKPALTAAINAILQPVRDHFATDPKAKELLKKVKVRLHADCPDVL